MTTTFAECSIHGRQRARQLPVTEFRMSGGVRTTWTVSKTWTRDGLVKCGHQDDSSRFDCNAPSPAIVIDATVTDTPCSDICTSATGRKCECSCGGTNHGGI